MKDQRGCLVAIDGAAAAGKSSLSRDLGGLFGMRYFNTGGVYRSFAFACLELGTPCTDEEAVVAAAMATAVDVSLDQPGGRFVINGVDRSEEIRDVGVTEVVSTVSHYKGVRSLATGVICRVARAELSHSAGLVVEGRDLTTQVFPDADVRILLVADAEVRERRRLLARGDSFVGARDAIDSASAEFFHPAAGVICIPTDALPWDMVIKNASDAVRRAMAVLGRRSDAES